jgi:N-acetylneuraminate synthase
VAEHVFVIAEAGVNHNGSAERAFELVDAAAAAGADAVKFQTFRTDKVVTLAAPKAAYQATNTGEGGSQIDMIRQLELGDEVFRRLATHAAQRNIEFMSTPFDLDSLRFLAGSDIGLRRLKVPSGEITNALLLLEAARTGLPLIVSTGMSTLDEIEEALAVIAFGFTRVNEAPSLEKCRAAFASPAGRAALKEKVTLLHCTTEYPAPLADVNLRAMETMRAAFGLPVGYSDHTQGIAVPIAAAALGAVAIEKHFTLDRALPGPDHRASLEPGELKAMVEGVRAASASLGVPEKTPTPSEKPNIPIARRSLVAARAIKKGEVFDAAMIDAKRPGGGLSPMRAWSLIGTRAKRDFAKDEALEA